jgi:hypothetical protein
VSDEDLEKQIKELEEKLAKDLGYVKVEPKILRHLTKPSATDRTRYPLCHPKRLLFSSFESTVAGV